MYKTVKSTVASDLIGNLSNNDAINDLSLCQQNRSNQITFSLTYDDMYRVTSKNLNLLFKSAIQSRQDLNSSFQ